jgi:hypothetical protein
MSKAAAASLRDVLALHYPDAQIEVLSKAKSATGKRHPSQK